MEVVPGTITVGITSAIMFIYIGPYTVKIYKNIYKKLQTIYLMLYKR